MFELIEKSQSARFIHNIANNTRDNCLFDQINQ